MGLEHELEAAGGEMLGDQRLGEVGEADAAQGGGLADVEVVGARARMQRWSRKSAGTTGRPWRAKYSGEPATTSRKGGVSLTPIMSASR
jgi:hypothetical protein